MDRLPLELQNILLQYFYPYDFSSAKIVSRQWRKIILGGLSLYNALLDENRIMRQLINTLQALIYLRNQIRTLAIHRNSNTVVKQRQLTIYFPQLTHIYIYLGSEIALQSNLGIRVLYNGIISISEYFFSSKVIMDVRVENKLSQSNYAIDLINGIRNAILVYITTFRYPNLTVTANDTLHVQGFAEYKNHIVLIQRVWFRNINNIFLSGPFLGLTRLVVSFDENAFQSSTREHGRNKLEDIIKIFDFNIFCDNVEAAQVPQLWKLTLEFGTVADSVFNLVNRFLEPHLITLALIAEFTVIRHINLDGLSLNTLEVSMPGPAAIIVTATAVNQQRVFPLGEHIPRSFQFSEYNNVEPQEHLVEIPKGYRIRLPTVLLTCTSAKKVIVNGKIG